MIWRWPNPRQAKWKSCCLPMEGLVPPSLEISYLLTQLLRISLNRSGRFLMGLEKLSYAFVPFSFTGIDRLWRRQTQQRASWTGSSTVPRSFSPKYLFSNGLMGGPTLYWGGLGSAKPPIWGWSRQLEWGKKILNLGFSKAIFRQGKERWVMTICKYLGGAPCPRSSGCCLVKSNKSLGRNLAAGWSSLPADDRRHGTCKNSAAWKVKIWVRSVNLLSQVHIGQIRGHGGSNGGDGQKSVCSPWPPLDRSDKVGSGIRIQKTNQPCNCKHTLL